MPAFQTKTIESILEPVAQQVSRLVVLHEEAERNGGVMPDLSLHVDGVQSAVENLVKVGIETVEGSDDQILRQDMPAMLRRVQEACDQLVDASTALRDDGNSSDGRRLLITGSRGILRATSLLLITFDDFEVRKLVKLCQVVVEYLVVVEVIDSMNDLVEFVKNLSPVLTRLTREVTQRANDLTSQDRKQALFQSLDTVRNQMPNLVNAMKTYISTRNRGHAIQEALESRDVLCKTMTTSIKEIITVLQANPLVDEEAWNFDDPSTARRMMLTYHSQQRTAHDWLLDTSAVPGCLGERCVRDMISMASQFGDRFGMGMMVATPDRSEEDREDGRIAIAKAISDVRSMIDVMGELRSQDKGATPQALALGKNTEEKLKLIGQLMASVVDAIEDVRANSRASNVFTFDQQLPVEKPTLLVRLERCQAVLQSQSEPQSLFEAAQLARSVSDDILRDISSLVGHPAQQHFASLGGCAQALGQAANDLASAIKSNMHNSPTGRNAATCTASLAGQVFGEYQRLLASMVVEQFADAKGPARQLVDCAMLSSDVVDRVPRFNTAARHFAGHATQILTSTRILGQSAYTEDRLTLNRILTLTSNLTELAGQMGRAAAICFDNPGDSSSSENLQLILKQWTEGVDELTQCTDDLIDTIVFLNLSEKACDEAFMQAESALSNGPAGTDDFLSAVTQICRRALRVAQVAHREADNCDDQAFVSSVQQASAEVQAAQDEMMQTAAFLVESNMVDASAQTEWRQLTQRTVENVATLRHLFEDYVAQFLGIPTGQEYSETSPPPRPPLPRGQMMSPYSVSSEPEEDAEASQLFRSGIVSPTSTTATGSQVPHPTQPILKAAYDLHLEAGQWSSRDNDIVAAAKRMAILMAKLSQLVRTEGGSRCDLIAVAKAIAEQALVVTRLATDLAAHCTDKRIRTMLLHACEKLPTIGNQLKIIATVKATMIGANVTEEDQEATEMLVGNAQNLMSSVRYTVRCAEAASIRIRVDSGIRVRWVRKRPLSLFNNTTV